MKIENTLAICLIALTLAGCQTQRNMTFTDWRAVDKSEADLNVADFSPVPIRKISVQDRDNRVRNSRFIFDNQKGMLFAERVVGGFFAPSVETTMQDQKAVIELAASRAEIIKPANIKRLQHRNKKSIGYYGYSDVSQNDSSCIFAAGGYRLKPTTYDNDMGDVDTVIHFYYCSKDVKSLNFEKMFRNLDIKD